VAASDAAEMQAILYALPLRPRMTVHTTPLTEHPNDPARPPGLGPGMPLDQQGPTVPNEPA
jgi:hypothetical protein